MRNLTLLQGALVLGGLTFLASVGVYYGWVYLPDWLQLGLRWGTTAVVGMYALRRRKFTLTIFFAMLLGTLVGLDLPHVGREMDVLTGIFIHLIKAIIGPLVFATLVVGIAGNEDLAQVGRMGWKSLLYFTLATLVALTLGLVAGNLFQPGVGIVAPEAVEVVTAPAAKGWKDIILHIFPENIAKSIAQGEILQIVVFSVLFGIGLALLKGPNKQTMLRAMESLAQVMFKFTHIVMYFAPVAAGAALAYSISRSGLGVLANLGLLVGSLYAALLAFLLLVLLPIALYIRLPLRSFLRALSEPASLAFATASSESALPKAMEVMERIGVPRKVVAFVLPTGYSFNLDGTALYLSLATLFVAQAAGHSFTLGEQIVILLTLLLTSKGVAGVARASFVILASTVTSNGLPEWPLALIVGVDVLMDMGRTTVNVIGNCLASAVVARWEGELDDAKAANPDWDTPLPESVVKLH